jgi:Spy/CpxP family protein refolding chaperone
MKKDLKRWIAIFACGLTLAAAAAWAQRGPGRDGTFDRLSRLKRSLSDAGAPALTQSQEDKINALITAYRDAHKPPERGSGTSAARTEYNNDILNGDSVGAAKQAASIAAAMTADMTTRLTDEAKFAVDVIAQLKTNGDQIGLLQKQLGNDRTVGLLLSLAGGPGGFGGRMGGPGPRPGGPSFRR